MYDFQGYDLPEDLRTYNTNPDRWINRGIAMALGCAFVMGIAFAVAYIKGWIS